MYTIGVDFGTLSARAVLTDAKNGQILAESVMAYPHGVISEYLPGDSVPLPKKTALQHPGDYLLALEKTVHEVLGQSGVSKEAVLGLGIDFTACTVLPVDEHFKPLCMKKAYEHRPHAYAKLWKHHAAQYAAEEMTRLAEERGEPFLARYGGKISSEWFLPKLKQIVDEDEALFHEAFAFMEAGDFLVAILTGTDKRSLCQAGYKACFSHKDGYPSEDFLGAWDERLRHVVAQKLSSHLQAVWTPAGNLSEEGRKLTGLTEKCVVAMANIDAHAALPSCGTMAPGAMLMIMGTSTCHLAVSRTECFIPGVAGVVKNATIPEFYTYEAGQACVGDSFEWFVKNALPASYAKEAAEKNISAHELLSQKAALRHAGESGLLALDWFNGNRSILNDTDLSGLILGYTLSTKPEDVYRALIESTAYGTRLILETFEKHGVFVETLAATGTLAQKNALLMQIYANVTGRAIRVVSSPQSCAKGSAIMAAVASGLYDSPAEASSHMADTVGRVYEPQAKEAAVYDKLYRDYLTLHDYFGRGGNDIMKRLMTIDGQNQ